MRKFAYLVTVQVTDDSPEEFRHDIKDGLDSKLNGFKHWVDEWTIESTEVEG